MKQPINMIPPESSAKGKKTKRAVSRKKLKNQSDEKNNSNGATSPEPKTGMN